MFPVRLLFIAAVENVKQNLAHKDEGDQNAPIPSTLRSISGLQLYIHAPLNALHPLWRRKLCFKMFEKNETLQFQAAHFTYFCLNMF